MSADGVPNTSALITRLINDLSSEFPGWVISREDSGRWAAIRTNWGAVYGQSSNELRDRLRQYSPD
jgi:hypothetical protein